MTRTLILLVALAALAACTPLRMVADVAVTGGQVVLGAADLVL